MKTPIETMLAFGILMLATGAAPAPDSGSPPQSTPAAIPTVEPAPAMPVITFEDLMKPNPVAQELWRLHDKYLPKETPTWASIEEMHKYFVAKFIATPGMGSGRMGPGIFVINPEQRLLESRAHDGIAITGLFAVAKLNLIGIAKHDKPVVFEPRAHGVVQSGTRALTEFEQKALADLLAGKETVTATGANERFVVGAIRARLDCLDCHGPAKAGDLLGAFSYVLKPAAAPAISDSFGNNTSIPLKRVLSPGPVAPAPTPNSSHP